MRNVDVVIPVYDGYEETKRCLASVLATIDSRWTRVVAINDATPDPRIHALLGDLASANDALVLLENPSNRGFVASANRGMEYDAGRDVLLLNSDTEVSGDWLHRLRQAAYGHDSVASVTPVSNNATICSFPNVCEDNERLFGLSTQAIDSSLAARFSTNDVVDTPTGVGFCMYMRRDCLNQIGGFDEEAFGRGYGEENDWCQRAEKTGWRNLQLLNCFVYHAGAASFGAEKGARTERALETLARRHPGYDAAVQDFILRDPARQHRIGAILGLFAEQSKAKVLTITHGLGGGAQQHVDELASFLAETALFLQISPHREDSVVLSVFDRGRRLKDRLLFDVSSEYEDLLGLLRELGIGRVHYHHTMGLHPRLWSVANDLGCGYDLTIHDYHLVNGNPTLTDGSGRFVGDDDSAFDARCAESSPLPSGASAGEWRQARAPLVERAERVIFPSVDACRRFQRFFTVHKPVVAEHPVHDSEPPSEPRWHVPSDRPLRVLLLGALSREKGADMVDAVANALKRDNIEFHLLGYAYQALSSSVIVHGPYNNPEVRKRIRAIEPDVAWFPAQWPETFSYTLSIAMQAGLPVVVPDIGAFSERVRDYPCSIVRAWDSSVNEWQVFWRAVLAGNMFPGAVGKSVRPVPDRSADVFYLDQYLQPVPAVSGVLSAETLRKLRDNHCVGGEALTRAERLLKRIWRLSRHPLLARLVARLPFRARQAFKRRLSSRPMHDIVHMR